MFSLPGTLRRIGKRMLRQHPYLEPGDDCFYLGEFDPGAGYATPVNDVILNFKIAPATAAMHAERAKWKRRAIEVVARSASRHLAALAAGNIEVGHDSGNGPGPGNGPGNGNGSRHGHCRRDTNPVLTVIPIPTSKVAGHAEYDDRLLRALAGLKKGSGLEVRELIRQRLSTPADHESPCRQSFAELLENCFLEQALATPAPTSVVLFDDVITDGKHFKVCQRLLRDYYGPLPVTGFFIARCVRGWPGPPRSPQKSASSNVHSGPARPLGRRTARFHRARGLRFLRTAKSAMRNPAAFQDCPGIPRGASVRPWSHSAKDQF